MSWNLFMKSFDRRQSLWSLKLSKRCKVTWFEINFIDSGEILLMSKGTLTISYRLLAIKVVHSTINHSIFKKSAEINIGTTLLIVMTGFSDLMYFISHSKISMSHYTLMSMSSAESVASRCCLKYFISWSKRSFQHK